MAGSNGQKQHLCGVQNIVPGESRDIRVARKRFYVDQAMNVTAYVKDVF